MFYVHQEAPAAADKVRGLKEQWDLIQTTVDRRIKLALAYVAFHKKAQQLAVEMDTLEQCVHSCNVRNWWL